MPGMEEAREEDIQERERGGDISPPPCKNLAACTSLRKGKKGLRRVSDSFSSSAESLPGLSPKPDEGPGGKSRPSKKRKKESEKLQQDEENRDPDVTMMLSSSAEVVVVRKKGVKSKLLKNFGGKESKKQKARKEEVQEKGKENDKERKKKKQNDDKETRTGRCKSFVKAKKEEKMGAVISDHYLVGASLGKGEAGEVFYGVDKKNNREVVGCTPLPDCNYVKRIFFITF